MGFLPRASIAHKHLSSQLRQDTHGMAGPVHLRCVCLFHLCEATGLPSIQRLTDDITENLVLHHVFRNHWQPKLLTIAKETEKHPPRRACASNTRCCDLRRRISYFRSRRPSRDHPAASPMKRAESEEHPGTKSSRVIPRHTIPLYGNR
jgi:hypothetical protein